MQQYKVDPITGRIAVRTVFPDEGVYVPHAYSVADPRSSPGFRSTLETETWIDVSEAVAAALEAAIASPLRAEDQTPAQQ